MGYLLRVPWFASHSSPLQRIKIDFLPMDDDSFHFQVWINDAEIADHQTRSLSNRGKKRADIQRDNSWGCPTSGR